MIHTAQEIEAAVKSLDLWGKLIDNQYCRYHVGDRVDVEHLGTGTILGQQMGGYHYAVLLDTGIALQSRTRLQHQKEQNDQPTQKPIL